MQNKTLTLAAFALLSASTTFSANAATNYSYFAGVDVGTHLSGKMNMKGSGDEGSVDQKSEPITGLSAGMIINDSHRIKLGFSFDKFKLDDQQMNDSEDSLDRETLLLSYDYMIPIANRVTWTVGGTLGYEFFDHESVIEPIDSSGQATGADDFNGALYGVQTGLQYDLGSNWTTGGEIAYLYHDKELQQGDVSSQIKDDVTVMANIQYHF